MSPRAAPDRATAAGGASAPATVRPAPVSAAETGEHWIDLASPGRLRRAGGLRRRPLVAAGGGRIDRADSARGAGGHRRRARSDPAGSASGAQQAQRPAGRSPARRRCRARGGRAGDRRGDDRARARRGRAAASPAGPRELVRAGRRARSRPVRCAERRLALRRSRRVDPPDHPAGSAAAARSGCSGGLLSRPPRPHPAAQHRTGATAGGLRHRGNRARSGRAAAAGTRAAVAGRRVAVAAAHGTPRCAGRRGRRGVDGTSLAARRGRSRRRTRLVELPRLGLVWLGQGDHLRLDARVRPARLAARGHHAAQRPLRPAPLLEGGDPRCLRRPALVSLASAGPQRRRVRAAHPVRASRPLLGAVRDESALGRGDRRDRALADHRPGGGGRDDLPSRRHAAQHQRRRDGARPGRAAREGRHLHRRHVRAQSDPAADAPVEHRGLRLPRRLHPVHPRLPAGPRRRRPRGHGAEPATPRAPPRWAWTSRSMFPCAARRSDRQSPTPTRSCAARATATCTAWHSTGHRAPTRTTTSSKSVETQPPGGIHLLRASAHARRSPSMAFCSRTGAGTASSSPERWR